MTSLTFLTGRETIRDQKPSKMDHYPWGQPSGYDHTSLLGILKHHKPDILIGDPWIESKRIRSFGDLKGPLNIEVGLQFCWGVTHGDWWDERCADEMIQQRQAARDPSWRNHWGEWGDGIMPPSWERLVTSFSVSGCSRKCVRTQYVQTRNLSVSRCVCVSLSLWVSLSLPLSLYLYIYIHTYIHTRN